MTATSGPVPSTLACTADPTSKAGLGLAGWSRRHFNTAGQSRISLASVEEMLPASTGSAW